MVQERSTCPFAESREEPSMTTEGAELLKEVVCEYLEWVKHHCDEQLVTCSILSTYTYVWTVTFETLGQTYILQTPAKKSVQITMTESLMLANVDG